MKTIWIAVAVTLGLLALYSLGHKIYQMKLEQPSYSVVKRTKDYELREYEPYLVAEVLQLGDFSSARNSGFMKVGGYIFGGNEREESIAMTAPVFDMPGQGERRISFMIPSQYALDDLPIPNDADVNLREEPARLMAAKRVRGRWNENKMNAALDAMKESLDEDGYRVIGEPVFAYYDPPSAPFFVRRTEVLIELSSELNVSKSTLERLEELPENAQFATFAGGCFWCIETAFDGMEGVYEAVSGYAGGSEADANYYQVARGQTEHREAVQVYYNPELVSYEDLLPVFWRQIDPTDDGGQFADRGFHYTTAIYVEGDEQKTAAEASKKEVEESGRFDQPIVTEIVDFTTFFPAEEEHQDFAQKRQEYYQRYKKGSGRADFIESEWAE